MNKKLILVVVLSLLLMAVMATSVGAQTTGVTYSVGVQIKNLDQANPANVTITYYNQDGTSAGTLNLTGTNAIAAGSAKTYAVLEGVSAGFNGSAVISSDRQVAAIANVFGNGFSGMGASYTALANGASPVNIPLVFREHFGFNTWFNVQNAGSAETTVTVRFDNGTTQVATVKPGAAATFDQKSNAALADPAPTGNAGYVGSATITSSNNTPIVATLLQQGPTTLLGFDGFLPSQASANPVMPLINTNNFGYITGIQIQNTGATATNVTITYTPSQAGAACTEMLSIAPASSTTFALGAFGSTSGAAETCANDARFVGSARVTANSANMPLVAIVNQLNSPANKGASYGAFNSTLATQTVELPLIMDRNFGYFTGFAIMNVGTTATTITCTYTGSSFTDSASVAPGGALTVQNLNKLADKYVGAATCTSTASPIVGVVNELGTLATSDSFLVYEGANR
ncbi:MAG: hypothetical protein H0T73_14420 [Ardenticatenales bacterium]|nr:hypothetical protein [Ardenticatenales bacterium]